jgi:hypothetical protein
MVDVFVEHSSLYKDSVGKEMEKRLLGGLGRF